MLKSLVILGVSAWLLYGASPQVSKERARQLKTSQNSNQQVNQLKPATGTPVPAPQQSPTSAKQNLDIKPSRYPWREVLAPANLPNVALVIIGIFGVFAALLTLHTIRKQVKAQMDADRAWVLPSIAGQPQEPLAGAVINTGTIPGIVWKIKIAGNTPAQIMRERYRCRTVPVMDGKPQLEKNPSYLTTEKIIAEALLFPPGYDYLMSIPLEATPEGTPTTTEMGEVIAGARAFCAYGKIEYRDAFGRNAETQFCAIYRPQLGGVMKSPDGTDLNPPGFRMDGPRGYNYNT